MKFLGAILSLLFLTLSVIPCSEEGPVNLQIQQQTDHDGCNDSETENACFSFCDCQSCNIHFVDFDPFSFKTVKKQVVQSDFAYFDNLGQEVLFSFLQPPRY